jgi:prolyl oligopeptidase
VQLRGQRLYFRTLARSPKGEVMALDLDRSATAPLRSDTAAASTRERQRQRTPAGALARATRVVAAPAQGAIERFLVGRDAVLTEVRDPFRRRIWRHAPGAGAGRELTGADNVGLVGEPMRERGDALVTVAAWTRPTRVATIDATGVLRDTTIVRAATLADVPELEAREELVPSHDGVRVPVAVVHRKGLPLDGRRPTILVGYGAYGLSINAAFDARTIAWLEQGGVLAFANVRGSGAYGDAWHRAGFKATKPNTWKDGLAVARWLIEQQYASPRTLAAWGRSAGGVFVGRMVTSVPELFGAAIFDVALLDTVRAQTSANGVTNVSEFGSVANPQEFAALLEMSTYHHIRAGAPYPAVLLVHGMNDPRVDAWHTLKTGARLLAANRDGAPVLLRLDTNDGHGVGRSASQGVEQLADIYGFLLWRLGQRRLEGEPVVTTLSR